MRERPDPLTPPESDVSGLEWFPFYHRRLIRSEFWRSSSGEVCKLSVELWCAAWEEVPAASLPNDDERLAELAGFGRRGLAEWKRLKRDVMRAWVLCSDGRWYHKTLARIANERMSIRAKWKADKKRQRGEMSTETAGVSTETEGSVHPPVHRDRQVDSSRARISSPLRDSVEASRLVDSIQERDSDSQDRARPAGPNVVTLPVTRESK